MISGYVERIGCDGLNVTRQWGVFWASSRFVEMEQASRAPKSDVEYNSKGTIGRIIAFLVYDPGECDEFGGMCRTGMDFVKLVAAM